MKILTYFAEESKPLNHIHGTQLNINKIKIVVCVEHDLSGLELGPPQV